MWAETLDAEGLSQGDLVEDLPFANVYPIAPVIKTSIHGKPGWLQTQALTEDGDGMCNVVTRVRRGTGLVLSYSCDIDKRNKKSRIFTAPVDLLSKLPLAEQQRVIEQSRVNLFPLVGTGHGDFYADLRLAMALDQRLFDNHRRLASMTDEGRLMLQARLAFLFTRRED